MRRLMTRPAAVRGRAKAECLLHTCTRNGSDNQPRNYYNTLTALETALKRPCLDFLLYSLLGGLLNGGESGSKHLHDNDKEQQQKVGEQIALRSRRRSSTRTTEKRKRSSRKSGVRLDAPAPIIQTLHHHHSTCKLMASNNCTSTSN